MRPATVALVASVVVAALALAAGYALGDLLAVALLFVPAGALWLAARLRWTAVDQVAWALFTGAAAIGLGLGMAAGLMLAAGVAALAAWDLGEFDRQARAAQASDRLRQVEWAHLRRLGGVCLLGFVAAGLAVSVQIRLDFAVIAALAIGALLALSQALRLTKRSR
jgi:hypothetical protein